MGKIQKVYTREFSRGGDAAGRNQWEADRTDSPRAGHLRFGHSRVEEGVVKTRLRGVCLRVGIKPHAERGSSSFETRSRAITAGAGYPKKSAEHLLTGSAMKYNFIEEHKQECPIVVMCGVLARLGKWFLRLAEAANLSPEAEKMLGLHKRFDRYLRSIRGDMAHHVFREICTRKESAAELETRSPADAGGGAVSAAQTTSGGDHQIRQDSSSGSKSFQSGICSERAEYQVGH